MAFRLHWVFAVEFARQSNDVTYEEWCELYYPHTNATDKQIQKACRMAHKILLREGFIVDEPMEVAFLGFGDGPDAWPRRDDPRPRLYEV